MISKMNHIKTPIENNNTYSCLFQIPPKNKRYVVIDTETTGIWKGNYLKQLAGVEIINGIITTNILNIFIDPNVLKNKLLKHCIIKEDIYNKDKNKLKVFREFLGDSLVFAHNAKFDREVLNRSFNAYNLETVPVLNFRCTMLIFLEIISPVDSLYNMNAITLQKCCKYFGLKTFGLKYHDAKTDSFMAARLIIKIYDEIDNNIKISKYFNYNDQDKLDTHYNIYKNIRKKNNDNNSYNSEFFISIKNNYIPPFLRNDDIKMNKKIPKIEGNKIDKKLTSDIESKNEQEISNIIVNQIINEYNPMKQMINK